MEGKKGKPRGIDRRASVAHRKGKASMETRKRKENIKRRARQGDEEENQSRRTENLTNEKGKKKREHAWQSNQFVDGRDRETTKKQNKPQK